MESAASALGEKVDYFIAALLTDLGGVTTFDMNTQLRHLSTLAAQNDDVLSFLIVCTSFRLHILFLTFVSYFHDLIVVL